MNKYEQWIWENVTKTYGMCAKVTAWMVKTFPELKRVHGNYYDEQGKQDHWWCVAPNGEIIDPTADQFPSGGFGYYGT